MTAGRPQIDRRSARALREIALWFAIAIILVAGIGFSWRPTPFAHALAAIFIACALLHAVVLYGGRSATAFLVT